ncbi:MAG: hypothetical protein ACYC2H_13355 [Thermoplasmatota archaeon]
MPRSPLATEVSWLCAAFAGGLALLSGAASLLSTRDLPREWTLWLVWPLLLAAMVLVHGGLALAVAGRVVSGPTRKARWSVGVNLASVLVVWGSALAWWVWATATGY